MKIPGVCYVDPVSTLRSYAQSITPDRANVLPIAHETPCKKRDREDVSHHAIPEPSYHPHDLEVVLLALLALRLALTDNALAEPLLLEAVIELL